MIRAGGDVADRELSFVIRAGSAVERQLHKCRIRQVAMQADRNTGHRFEVFRVQKHSGDFERINHITGGKGKRKVLKNVLLIVVGDRVREVDRIGRVLLQRIFQFNHRLLTRRTDDRQFHLGRRDNHVFRRFVDLYQFVKQDLDLLPLVINLVRYRCAAHELRRVLVVRSPVRTADIGTRIDDNQQQHSIQQAE